MSLYGTEMKNVKSVFFRYGSLNVSFIHKDAIEKKKGKHINNTLMAKAQV